MANVIETTDAPASITTPYTLLVGQTAAGAIGVAFNSDFYRIDLTAGHQYVFALLGAGGSASLPDSLLTLEKLDGASGGTLTVASNDDSLGDGNSVIRFTAPETATYYLNAQGYWDFVGTYLLAANEGTRLNVGAELARNLLDNNDTGAQWTTNEGTSGNVTIGFRKTLAGVGATQFTDAQKAATQQITAMISEVCGLTFTYVDPTGFTDSATILLQNINDPFFPDRMGSSFSARRCFMWVACPAPLRR